MKNEEKIKEIVNREFTTGIDLKDDKDVKKLLLEMAEWKDEQFAEENKWISVEDKLPPFVTTEDGSQYSKPVFCKEKCGSYCVARFVRWKTGHYMWLDSSDEQPNVKFWKEIKD